MRLMLVWQGNCRQSQPMESMNFSRTDTLMDGVCSTVVKMVLVFIQQRG
ncbi:hypothetical protein KCQ_18917 [Pectobacterium atrosepticum ICMP 1526]|nr:hypothetical protein KCQ_18917 [Pectobacterium atrosepticum ICMP 1526]